MRGEHVNIEGANLMPGPSSYFHVRVFSLSFSHFHDEYVTDISDELLPCKRFTVSFFCICWPGSPVSLFPPGIGRKRLPCKPTGFSILTSTVKGPRCNHLYTKWDGISGWQIDAGFPFPFENIAYVGNKKHVIVLHLEWFLYRMILPVTVGSEPKCDQNLHLSG